MSLRSAQQQQKNHPFGWIFCWLCSVIDDVRTSDPIKHSEYSAQNAEIQKFIEKMGKKNDEGYLDAA